MSVTFLWTADKRIFLESMLRVQAICGKGWDDRQGYPLCGSATDAFLQCFRIRTWTSLVP